MNTQDDGARASQGGHVNGIREESIWPMPNGMDAAARQAREAAERFGRTLGLSGEKGERLALQSTKNMEAVAHCRLILAKAFQASSKSWMEMVQGQWKRNFDGMERLMQAGSVQEFGMIQGELVRENLEHILKDSRSIAESSMRAADEAGRALSAMSEECTGEEG